MNNELNSNFKESINDPKSFEMMLRNTDIQ